MLAKQINGLGILDVIQDLDKQNQQHKQRAHSCELDCAAVLGILGEGKGG